MCGIAGYVGSEFISDERAQRCISVMGRRGPDGHGVYRHNALPGRHVLLLHSRLRIIDLDDRANQPFKKDGKIIAYNGELYNYIELAADLKRRGVSFATSSDTEVMVSALSEAGLDALDQFEGMWAFALYDETDGSLVLCRDRFGEKPLYVLPDGSGGFYFGSEVKFLIALSGRRLRPNYRQIHRYIVNGYKSLYKQRETFFEGLEEVRPATWMRVAATGASHTSCYWSPVYRPDYRLSYHDCVELARIKLIDSVRLRLRADVPLAFCLSGGTDSNTVISIAKKILGYDVHGFYVRNDDARYVEDDFVDATVKELGIRYSAVPVSTVNAMENLRAITRYHDAPIYFVAYYPHWLMMREIAADGFRVAVSGTAADELFGGYYMHHNAYLYEVRNNITGHKKALDDWVAKVQPVIRNPKLRDPELFFGTPDYDEIMYFEHEKYSQYLTGDFLEPYREKTYTDSFLRNRTMNELFEEHTPAILHEDDLNAMYFSVENRSPFLDRGLFETVMCFPTEYLIRDGMSKSILREAMRGIVADKVLDNPIKVGFNAPVLDFIDGGDDETRAHILDDSDIFQHVRKDVIEDMLGRDKLSDSDSKFFFAFLACKMFLEEVVSGSAG